MKLSWLIPQEKKFFDMMEKYAELTKTGANLLVELFLHFDAREQKWIEIKRVEKQGDDLLHSMVEELNATFVTPMDREDIYSLASQMDDILDYMEGVAERIILFKLKSRPSYLVELSELLYQATSELVHAIGLLRNTNKWHDLKKHTIEINRIENRGDEVSRMAIAQMFEETDPVEIIKLKEITEFVENAIDRCEDVADVLENLNIKNA